MRITSLSEITLWYREKFAAPSQEKVGVEWERFGVISQGAGKIDPCPYIGGYEYILETLAREYGWEVVDRTDGHIFTLQKGSTLITTEGDGKPEISGSPFVDLHDVFTELEEISQCIESIGKKQGISWVDQGLQPFSPMEDIPLAPKPRYHTFLEVFKGSHQEKWMQMYMKAVSGVHINVDVENEADLLAKMQMCFRIAPLMCGIFANAPMENGKASGVASARRRKIFCEKCDRSRLMDGILGDDFSLEKWIEWYISQPMVVIFRGKDTIRVPENFSFRQWMEEGFEGEYPTMEDFDVHLKTMWVDTRFRPGYLEFRPLDTLPFDFLQGAVSLFTGVIYSSEGKALLEEITKNWEESEYEKIHKCAWEQGIQAEYKGVNFLDAGRKLVQLAEKILRQRGLGEETFLKPVSFLLDEKKTPGDIFLEKGINQSLL